MRKSRILIGVVVLSVILFVWGIYNTLFNNTYNDLIYSNKPYNSPKIDKIAKSIFILSANVDWEPMLEKKNDPEQFIKRIAEAKNMHPDLVVFPQGFPELKPIRDIKSSLDEIQKILKNSGFYTVVTLNIENDGIRPTSFLFDRKGDLIGKYEKTHKFSDERIELADKVPVFQCDFGTLSLQIGSDVYFHELTEIYRKLGANITVCSLTPMVLEDKMQINTILIGLTADFSIPLVTSGYKTIYPDYLTNFERYGSRGLAFGNSSIISAEGDILATGGLKSDWAFSSIFLGKPTPMLKVRKEILDDLFQEKPIAPVIKKDLITISLINQSLDDDIGKEGFKHVINQLQLAGIRHSDVALMYEYSASIEKYIPQIQNIAKRYKMYVIFACPYDSAGNVDAFLVDRSGNISYRYHKITQNKFAHSVPIYDADFGRIGIRVCADKSVPAIDRIFALKGATIVFNPDQSWGQGADYIINYEKSRALTNGLIYARTTHISSESGHRSRIIDRYGIVLAQSQLSQGDVTTQIINLKDNPPYYSWSMNNPYYSLKHFYLRKIKRRQQSYWMSNSLPLATGTLAENIMNGRRVNLYKKYLDY